MPLPEPPRAPVNDLQTSYSQLFDVSPFPAVVSRLKDHTVLAINARTSEIIGISQRDAIGRVVSDYYVDPSERLELADRLRRDGRADNLRLRIKRASGEPFWVLASSRLVTWQTEPAVLTVFHDISEQLAAEASLKASERRLVTQSDALTGLTARYTNPDERFDERLRSILDISASALHVARLSMWRFDDLRSVIRCVGMCRGSGEYECGAMLGRQDAPAYFEALERERVIAAHDARTDPRTREFGDAYLVPHNIHAMLDVPLRHDNTTVGVLCAEHVGGARMWTVDEQNFAVSVGNLIVVAIAEEERRSALARLAESEARARLIVDTAHDAFIGIDSSGGIVAWNVQAEATFGWTREEALGRNLANTIVPAAFREAHNSGMRRFHDTGAAPVVNQRLELTALHRSGREFPIELTITSPMSVEHGFFFGAFLRDISDRREQDAELRRAKESAEAATRAKSEFLANMSHELRTPLNGVLGYAQLLQRDSSLNATQRDALEAIAKCGSQLLDLINDVLDLSKIEAGRLDIEEAPTDLTRLITDLTYVVAEAADRKGLQLTMSIDADVPRSVVLDGRHLRQVLLNLLGNAIKFTTTGDVRLAIGRADERLTFSVSDTGPGIEPEALTEIFAAFAQTKTGAAAGGTGLGLTICDHLITKMGGDLKVDSVLGEGSRFWFTLPLVQGRQAARSTRQDAETAVPPLDARLAPGQALTAMVVDDSTANRHILASLLESAGVAVITAAGGLEAIELARAHRPQVVFMDLKMNDLDGLEATRRLARDPATATIPVIAVTASALGDVRKTARDAGCVDYLSKPVRAQLLFGMLQTHLGMRFVSGRDQPAPRGASVTGVDRHVEIGTRLRNAVTLGDVSDIQALAQHLMQGDAAEAALGERITRLAINFDFAGLGELADSLDAETG
ncbi:MAG TPA: PAS domain S-box protein [Vicinamibacterales bacterium]|jgi:PAS domain S-box-containing protein|nr:PAS domain S-box protein [Vicinamibacterales bacterium]